MGVVDVTSADAVLAAMDEFDDLGQDAFLSKYGFGPARDYEVLRDGKTYPSKAILGAAHGHQHPAKGPLQADTFNGGKQTTSRLEALGFEIQRLDETAAANVWVVRAGEKGEAEQLCLDKRVCGIGWEDLPDLSTLGEEGIDAEIDAVYGGQNEGRIRNYKVQVRDFMSIRRGDLILMPRKSGASREIAVGRVVGGYEHRPDLSPVTNHVRGTDWFGTASREQFAALLKWLNRPVTVGRVPVDSELVLESLRSGAAIRLAEEASGKGLMAGILSDVLAAISTGQGDVVAERLGTDAPKTLAEWVGPDHPIQHGVGIGTPADVPWVAVYPKGSQPTAQTGFYVVYLFAADGSAAFLSLIQGTEHVRGGHSVLRKRAADLRSAAGVDAAGDEVDLAKAGGRPAKYASGSAYAIRYDVDAIPDDDALKADLGEMVALMEQAAAVGLTFHPEIEAIHLVFKWSSDLKPDTVALHQAVAEGQGSVWWSKFGTGDSPIGKRNREQIEEQLADGIPTFAFLYGGGQTFRTRLEQLALDPDDVDEDRMCDYYSKDECNMFARLTSFEQLPEGWLQSHVVLASDPDPSKMQGALSNQTTPLFVHEAFMPTSAPPPAAPKLDMAWLTSETLWPEEALQELLEALDKPGQVILAGPPGTGKTWIAERIARYLTQDQPLRTRIVQLHPSYGYEEFVEGLRPVAEHGAISFKRTDGVILDMVSEMEGSDDDYVLIIDELNRANIPRVFGELLYLLEYRDKEIDLQFSKGFELPENLKIIATMNTADRSTRSIDVALRRRFEIFECPADKDVLTRYYDHGSRTSGVANLVEGFESLNADLTEKLDRHHTIGQSFFMRETFTSNDLDRGWKRQILPLIEDYFFDQQDLVEQFTQEKYWPGA